MSTNNNRVLVVTYHFPPYGGVEVFRVAKIIKHLPEAGWDPIVFTLDESERSDMSNGTTSNSYLNDVGDKSLEVRSTEHIFNSTFGKYIGELGWLPGNVNKLLNIIDEWNIDAVFHTGNPFLPFLTALCIKSFKDIPYLIDLRDPWFLSNQYFNYHNDTNEAVRYLHQISEKVVFKYVDRIITNTDLMEEEYKSRYPDIANKFNTVYNGFDPDDYEVPAVKESDAFRIAYPGKFYGQVDAFVEAFGRLVDTTNQYVEFVHMGEISNEPTRMFYELMRSRGLQSNLVSKGHTEFPEVVSILKGSDVGIVVTRENDITHIPMKVFDYLACGLPIVGIDSNDGQLARLLSSLDYSHIANHGDCNAICQALSLCRKYDSRVERGDTIRKYTCQNQTRNLAQILEQTTSD